MHDDDGSLLFAYYKDGATDPTILYFAYALKEYMISTTPTPILPLFNFSLFFRHHSTFFTHTQQQEKIRSNNPPPFWGFVFVFTTTFRSESQSAIANPHFAAQISILYSLARSILHSSITPFSRIPLFADFGFRPFTPHFHVLLRIPILSST
ncbi:unnamed protein product [Sphenostylis stenocarpa]|uniref:TCTP domain-containing protein n=1 Tax=Sphenostylis stenocarpa TaxID=92480 RepID=A0AA86SV99_9FABA|nr:unnamed protein product [Sphenostylis stenocarpa]